MTQPADSYSCMTRLAAGVYDDGHGGLHVDIDEFVTATGGDPRNPRDVDAAIIKVRAVVAAHGIPLLELER